MTPQEFCYWLQGFFEITEASSNRGADGLSEGQARMIREHLNLVFNKKTSHVVTDPGVTHPSPWVLGGTTPTIPFDTRIVC